jgi:hypothetical protein
MGQDQQTLALTKFKGANLTDTRTSIDDAEFSFLENAIPIGSGNVKLVPGSTLLASNEGTVVIAAGIKSLWGFSFNTSGVSSGLLFTVNNDGSMTQIDPQTGNTSVVAVAGTVTTSARLTMSADNPLMIIDPTKGFFLYEGTNFKTSATRVGTDIASFEGRTWIVTAPRTITFTAPNTVADFNPGPGGGSTTISDSAFPGTISRLLSALEQLWIVGPGAVDAISNVQTSAGITTFSLTNIVGGVGSTFASSVSTFFRTFLFLTPYGVYAIVGATPQKLSDKLDGLFPSLSLGSDAPAAVTTVHNVFVWCVLVTYTDPVTGNRPLLLCFSQGKWFFASAGTLTSIASVLIGGQPKLFGTDGTHIFQIFADVTKAVNYTIQTKLFDFGDATMMKEWLRLGLEINSASGSVTPLVTLENEIPSLSQNFAPTSNADIVFVNNANIAITFVGTGAIVWVHTGLQILRNAANIEIQGNYLGMTIVGKDPVWQLAAAEMEIKPAGKWNPLR